MAYTPVTALLRGLKVLETVNRIGPATLTEVREATGLPKASALRALETLCYGGYVAQDGESRRYLVAARSLALSNNYRADAALLAAGRPVMQRLREASGWPSDLAIYQAGKMAIADTNRQPGTFSVNRTVGSRVSVMRTAIGRAYLAFSTEAQRAAILEDLVAGGDADERDAGDAARVAALVERTRERGYAVSDREFVPTIRAAAVPVMHHGRVLCAFNLIALAQAVPLATFEDTYIPMLKEARARIEAALSEAGDA